MLTGYTKRLARLSFDHLASYTSGLFGWKEPLNVEQVVTVAESKQVIYEGFKKARLPKEEAGILVDEQYGVGILRDATQHGTITAASVEKSGQEEFDFVYGDDFAKHIDSPGLGSVASQLSHAGSLRKPEMRKLVRELCQAGGQSDGVTDDPYHEMEA
jgi:myo-inositol catabolism protein IolC